LNSIKDIITFRIGINRCVGYLNTWTWAPIKTTIRLLVFSIK